MMGGADHVHEWTECQSGGEFEMPEGRWMSYDDIEGDPRPTWWEVAAGVAGVLAVGLAFAFLRPIVAFMLDLAKAVGIDG